jgi:hypothetical protein
MGLKRWLVDVLITYSNLPKAKREVEMRVKSRVLKLRLGISHRCIVDSTVITW